MVGIRNPGSPAVTILVVVAAQELASCALFRLIKLDLEGLIYGRVEIIGIGWKKLDDGFEVLFDLGRWQTAQKML